MSTINSVRFDLNLVEKINPGVPFWSMRINSGLIRILSIAVAILIVTGWTCSGQRMLRYYGVDDIDPDEFGFLRDSLGGNMGMVELWPDSGAWKNALNEAEKYDLNIIIWPLGSGHQWTPWAWDGSSWDISEGLSAMQFAERYITSGGKALLAVVMSHEPFYNNGDPFTAAEMKMLYAALKEAAPHVKLFVYMNDMAHYDTRPETRIENGLMDIAGIWLHCFGEAEGTTGDALEEIDKDYALVRQKELDIQLFFAVQTFGIQGTRYKMPTAAEMQEFGMSVLEKQKLDGVFWYPWDRVASDYTSYLSGDRYDAAEQDRWEVVRQLSAYLPPEASEGRAARPGFSLAQNRPNPVNSVTTIAFSISESGYYRLKVMNLLGREVATLFEGTVPPGSYSVKLDARDLPPGLYLYSLQGGRSVIAKKMTIK